MRVIDQDSEFLRFIEQRDLMPGSAIVIESRDPVADALCDGIAQRRDARHRTGATQHAISDLAGRGYRSPLLAACLSVSMISLAGIPPTAGCPATGRS